ncbi:hypothetical protein [Chromohalobacter nigrandesensis]|uniref:hypothetical protein n=1 Tax=Chromohalobacter nigrandesensis TaxID=119863 RepID=UPI001FF32102|nr:hypothetical protein [Chromohalobacter nigrandesensis]MCK0744129.1 hypothetical protein [Chromohalobacter nigrandesensis]
MLNIDDIFREKQSVAPCLVKGKWYRVQWTPDLSAGERLNLGVAFLPQQGAPYVRTIDDFGRLRCLFDDRAEFHAKLACRVAEMMIESEPNPENWTSPQLSIVEGGFAQGESAEEVVERMMEDLVPLGAPRGHRSTRHSPVTKKRAYRRIGDSLAFRLGSEYRQHVPENPKIKTELGINLFLPFRRERDGHEAATIVSADFTKPEKIQGELYLGHRDVSVATTEKAFCNGKIFILRPGGNMKDADLRVAEEEVRDFSLYLKSLRVPHYLGKDTDELTDAIKHWCVDEAA